MIPQDKSCSHRLVSFLVQREFIIKNVADGYYLADGQNGCLSWQFSC